MSFGIGQPVPRVEDPRLVTGAGRFTDDIDLPGQLYAALFRLPHAHGRIARLDGRRGRRPGSLPFRSGSFTDYNIPRADQVPDIDMTFNEVLEPTDYRGVKGICEGGASGPHCGR